MFSSIENGFYLTYRWDPNGYNMALSGIGSNDNDGVLYIP